MASLAHSSSTSTSTTSSSSLLSSSGRELLLDLKRSSAQASSSSSSGGGSSTYKVPVLPAYNTKLVQACFRDLNVTVQELDLQVQAVAQIEQQQQLQQQQRDNNNGPHAREEDGSEDKDSGKPNMPVRPSILLLNASIRRYKRCLLAYHHHRMNTIKDIQRLQQPTSGGSYGAAAAVAVAVDSPHGDVSPDGDDRGAGATTTTTTTTMGHNPVVSTNAQEAAFAAEYSTLLASYSSRVFELGLLPPTSHMVQVRVVRDAGSVVLPDSGRPVTLSRGACLFVDRADVQDFLQQGVVQIYDGEEVDF